MACVIALTAALTCTPSIVQATSEDSSLKEEKAVTDITGQENEQKVEDKSTANLLKGGITLLEDSEETEKNASESEEQEETTSEAEDVSDSRSVDGDSVNLLSLEDTPSVVSDDIVTISTADDLMKILTATDSSETAGKTYVLENNITVDTSSLSASYTSVVKSDESRVFSGNLNGNNHTITVAKSTDAVSKPLFDAFRKANATTSVSSLSDLPKIENLTVKFEGDVEGATLAANIYDVYVENINVEFNNVLPATYDSKNYAAGLVGTFNSGMNFSYIHNVKINGGTIGSYDSTTGTDGAASAGIANVTSTTTYVYLEDVNVNVDQIQAFNKGKGTVSVSGGISHITGDGGECEFNRVTVNVKNNVRAKTEGDAQVDVTGLTYQSYALSDCTVDVGGDILAENYGTDSYNLVVAQGLGFQIRTRNNNGQSNIEKSLGLKIGKDKAENCTVKANNIKAYSLDCGATVAGGFAYYIEADASFVNDEVNVKNIVADCGEEGTAATYGFTAAYMCNRNDVQPMERCTVSADSIQSTCSNGGTAYALGFEAYGSNQKKNCTVKVGEIIAQGGGTNEEIISSGFSLCVGDPNKGFIPSSDEKIKAYDGCVVEVDNIISKETDEKGDSNLYVAGFIIETYDSDEQYDEDCIGNYIYSNNNVEINNSIQAIRNGKEDDSCEALFAFANDGQAVLNDNTVKIPKANAHIFDIDGKDHVRFTLTESDGRAENYSEWGSNNKVKFEDETYLVENDYDDSSDKYGTAWKLIRCVTYTYDLDGGTGASEVDYSGKEILAGERITLLEAPTLDGSTFVGWSDGTNTYEVGEELELNENVIFKAVWQNKVSFDLDGGDVGNPDEYKEQIVIRNSEVKLPVAPEREGYIFKGWSCGDALYQSGESVKIEKDTEFKAVWEKEESQKDEERKNSGDSSDTNNSNDKNTNNKNTDVNKTESNSADEVNTGDNSNPMMYIFGTVAAVAVLIVALILGKKRKC